MRDIFIYTLTDPRNNEIRYVGKTINPRKRLQSHLTKSKNLKHHCARWIQLLVKENLNPIMNIIEIIDELTWKERERYWISFFRNKYNLTNICEGGEGGATFGRLGKKNSKEHIEKSRKGRLGTKNKSIHKNNELRKLKLKEWRTKTERKILQYDLNGNFIKEWPSSVKCAREMGWNYSNINRACQNLNFTAHGYLWRFKLNEIFDKKIEKYLPPPKKTRKINQYTKDEKYIKTFSSIKEASLDTGVLRTNIANSLSKRAKTAGGFIWKYFE